jgi:hypothetical protein
MDIPDCLYSTTNYTKVILPNHSQKAREVDNSIAKQWIQPCIESLVEVDDIWTQSALGGKQAETPRGHCLMENVKCEDNDEQTGCRDEHSYDNC